jgi:hypothetical protein
MKLMAFVIVKRNSLMKENVAVGIIFKCNEKVWINITATSVK